MFLFFLPIHVTNLESPYGVAAHISRDEYLENNTILDRIKDAGIQWIRTDFDWYRYIYNIDGFEFVMGPVRNHSLNVLPIITYENRPPINYLEEAIDRTRMIVSRYQSELKYWEILNEPNIAGFWGGTPDPAGYALLLKESYKAIKEINSSLQVVFGGLAGAPIIFFNETLNEFKDGNLPFDIINIHPYRAGLHNFTMVEYFKKDIESFVNLAKEKSKEKRDFPIWITEMGYSTHYKGFDYPRWLFKTIFSMLPKTTNYKKIKRIGYLHGINFTGGSSLCVTPLRSILSEALNGTEFSDFEIKNIDFDYYFIQNHTLEEDFDMVIVPPSEYYTQIAFNATYSFVKNGGKLVFLQGVPLYYNVETEARRKLKKLISFQVGDILRLFHHKVFLNIHLKYRMNFEHLIFQLKLEHDFFQ
ncbi:beta-galactosidase-like protein [Histomonas meleagridis]|nr:beta-galactosidase-like protein [Histomonas meleagridis]